jgi:hypothetical protein
MIAATSCPHCGAELTRSEIGRLYASLRKSRGGGRPRRVPGGGKQNMEITPRASDLMPHVLLLLQEAAGHELRKGEIENAMRGKVLEMHYSYRAPALAFALTYLKRQGLLDNPRHGVWGATEQGRLAQMTLPLAREIERRLEQEYLNKKQKHQEREG